MYISFINHFQSGRWQTDYKNMRLICKNILDMLAYKLYLTNPIHNDDVKVVLWHFINDSWQLTGLNYKVIVNEILCMQFYGVNKIIGENISIYI